ncbi:hypothetical protein COBT_000750 [Conglomerata obtusa]
MINNDFNAARDYIENLESQMINEKAKYTQRMLKERITRLKIEYNKYTSSFTISENFCKMKCNSLKDTFMKVKDMNEPDVISTTKRINFCKNILNDDKDKNVDRNGSDLIRENDSDCILLSKTNKSKQNVEDSKNLSECKIYENLINVNINITDCDNIIIRNCTNIKAGPFNCATSVYLNSVINASLIFSAKQIRLSHCKNIKLKVFTQTGIFLEDSQNIEIEKFSCSNEAKNNYFIVKDFSNPFSNANYRIVEE